VAAEWAELDLDGVIGDGDDPAVAAVTIAELGVGVAMSTGRRRAARRALLDDVLASLPVIDDGLAVALAHTGLLVAARRSGRPRGAHDLVIAATALGTGRVVVTADRTGFTGLPGVVVRHLR
jgi:tRNA(fMet)-specific endonuclease VapC